MKERLIVAPLTANEPHLRNVTNGKARARHERSAMEGAAGIKPGPFDSALSDYGSLPFKENRRRNAMTRTRQRVCNLVALPDHSNCASMHVTVAGSGPRKRCANDTADSLTELLVG